jgi:hypothetical protein
LDAQPDNASPASATAETMVAAEREVIMPVT